MIYREDDGRPSMVDTIINAGPFKAGGAIGIPLTASAFNRLRDELIELKAIQMKAEASGRG